MQEKFKQKSQAKILLIYKVNIHKYSEQINGIFVLGWVFFFRQNSTFYLAIFDKNCLLLKRYCCPQLKLEKIMSKVQRFSVLSFPIKLFDKD